MNLCLLASVAHQLVLVCMDPTTERLNELIVLVQHVFHRPRRSIVDAHRIALPSPLSTMRSETGCVSCLASITLARTWPAGEAPRLRQSLEEMADESKSHSLLNECGLTENALEAFPEGSAGNRWSWSEVKQLSDSLLQALDAGLEHALLASMMTVDKYAAAESFCRLSMAYAPIPDLHIMWLLHLCDAHQEMQSWAEAA